MRSLGRIEVDDDGCGSVHVRSTVADPTVRANVAALLADAWGMAALEKGEPDLEGATYDPRFPELETLIRKAKADWIRWGDYLVKAIERRLRAGTLLPLNGDNESALRLLFHDHRVAAVVQFSGHDSAEPATVRRLVQLGLVDPDFASSAPIVVSARLGAGLEALAVAQAKGDPPSFEELARAAVAPPLTDATIHAATYARHRGAIYMRRVADDALSEAERVLTEDERAKIGASVGRSIEVNESIQRTVERLREAVIGTALTNNLERVARTEVQTAHAWGALASLVDTAEKIGERDPLIYRTVNRHACSDCQRIYGTLGQDPVVYRLSYVLQRENAGGNFRLPRAAWGPVIGCTHPNCTCPPWAIWREDLHALIRKTVATMIHR